MWKCGAKDNNSKFLYPELVAEHSQFTKEIREMIINSEGYSSLEKYWEVIEVY